MTTPPFLDSHYDATELRYNSNHGKDGKFSSKHGGAGGGSAGGGLPSHKIELENGKPVHLVDAKELSPEEFAKLHNAKVTPDQAEEVKLYSDPTVGLAMNGYLRGYYRDHVDPEEEQVLQEHIQKLQGAINQNAVAVDAMAFRRTRLDAFGLDPKLVEGSPEEVTAKLQGLVGSTWSDKGFMSTSVIHQTDGSLHYTDYPIEMQMRLPAGTKGVYMNRDDLTHFPVEREFLLPAGTEHAVVGVHHDGKKWVVETQVVNQLADAPIPTSRAAANPAPSGKKPKKSMLLADSPQFHRVQKFKWLPDDEKSAPAGAAEG